MTSIPTDIERLTDELMTFFGVIMKGYQQEAFRTMAELDLSMSQMRALFVLSGSGEQALHELVPKLGLSVAATGRAVDVLVRAGLVDRREDPADRRVKRINLTPAGEQLLDTFTALRREGVTQLAARLDDEQRALLSQALRPVIADLGADPRLCKGGAA
jgi:DNA-binding MarR family transcriptional regulator